ncbi:hypothetical protein [Arthrobacter sp. SO5]|uniref:hypothetical protein n=1 Tax=Arthrobacter sp. SO5 TaxID=1897055 RepID=UPI001E318BFF|nr:hypothetical protein [Arthrobacter sp. SO5]
MKLIGTRVALSLWMSGLLLWRSVDRRKGSRIQPDGPGDHRERGDVPGWVMITLMSAVLVAALLALAGPALEALFNQAMDKVGQ